MPLFDAKCEKCGHIWEVMQKWEEQVGECPLCESAFTKLLMPRMGPVHKAKDPYDYLDGRIPDSKPIKSFANDRRRGGKDTT